MLAYDVFTNDAFSVAEVREAVDNMVYIPQELNRLGIFTPDPISTTTVIITRNSETLALVPITERGSQPTLLERDKRSARSLSTVALRQEDRINSESLQNIAPEGAPFEVALERGMAEVDKRQRKMMRKLELTREYHRLAAINGYVLDADGSVVLDYYTEFGLVRPAAVLIDTALTDGALRKAITQNIKRPMATALTTAGRNLPTRLLALCGDEFYDELITAPEIRETYKIQQAGAELRAELKLYDSFDFAGVTWMNYRGAIGTAAFGVPADECIFVPIGVEDMWVEFRSPGEDMREVNQPGKEFYSYVSPDFRPNMMQWVDVFLYAYPLFACLVPEALLRGKLTP